MHLVELYTGTMPRATFTTRSSSHGRNGDLEAARESEEEDHGGEGQALLRQGQGTREGGRRLSRAASAYGSTPAAPTGALHHTNSTAHFIQLDETLDSALTQSGSILKLSGLIDDRGGEFERYRVTDVEMKKMSRPVRKFYQDQNEILDSFLEVDEILDNTRAAVNGALGMSDGPVIAANSAATSSAQAQQELNSLVKHALNVNIAVNVGLLVAKIAVVLISNSMSLIASTVDSAMDLLSTLIIFSASRFIALPSSEFPTGKRRMEPLSILVFSVIMISAFLQVFLESARRMLDPDLQPAEIPPSGIAAMVGTIVIKSAIWVWCRR